jgi:hydroxypyruvate isomerase
MPKFAANLSMMFNEYPFLDRFQAAADAGFQAVEYLFPYEFEAEDVAHALNDACLTQALFNMPPGNWAEGERGLAALPERRRDFVASVDKAVHYAKALKPKKLHMMAGIADASDLRAIASYKDALSIAAEKTGEAGIGLVIEPINRRDMPGYFLNHFEQAAQLIRDINMTHVQLQFDIYHRQILHGDVLMGLRELMPIIGHIQIASVPLRNEPNSGELNDSLIFQEVDALGYQGYIGCEYRPAGHTLNGLSWFRR